MGELNKLQLHQRTNLSLSLFCAGVALILLSAGIYFAEKQDLALMANCKLRTTKNGFVTSYKQTDIFVDFGPLQDIYLAADGEAVVLPTNEFFDDRCFNDTRTVAGAFIRSVFDPMQAAELKTLVHDKLLNHDSEMVERNDRRVMKSYGTGVGVYLDRPFGTPHRVILSSVATDRGDKGLRVEMASIFQAMQSVHKIIANERGISTIFIPLIGAGKGGVPPQLSFRAVMIAALEARCAEGGHAIKQVHVVVYHQKGKEPQVAVNKAKQAVRELVSLYQEVSR